MTQPTTKPDGSEVWRVRRGTPGDDYHGCAPSACMILDTPNHGAAAYIVARMLHEDKDDAACLLRADLIAQAPQLKAEVEKLRADMAWIATVANHAFTDPKLRADGARALQRILKRAQP